MVRASLCVLLIVLVGAAPSSAASWHSCRDGFGAECTRVTVPLDRAGLLAGTVSLRVARLPGPAGGRTVMYLSGGPGSGGLDELESILWSVSGLTSSHRVVTFDQRGTGRSGLLRCPEAEADARLRSTAAGEACARRLGPARDHYATADSVEDLEAVRRALGVERLTLFGVSYGTELALAYARAYPAHVERMALDSVADPDDRDPFGLAGFRAMGATLEALCPAGCAGVSEYPAADLARLAARLRTAPLRGVVHDADGHARTRSLRPVTIADLLYDADYDPALRAGVPAAVRAALAGDAAPLLRLAAVGDQLNALPAPASFSSARYTAVCAETPLPWDAATPPAARLGEARRRAAALGPGAFLPFDFDTAAADEIDLCLRWPAPAFPPAAVAPGPYPAVPTLLLQGGEDLRTPPEVSARVAAEIPGAQRVVVPGIGHGTVTADSSGCAPALLLRFLDGNPIATSCPRVATGVPAVAIPPRRFADIPTTGVPLRGTSPAAPRRGLSPAAARLRRTVTGLGLTLDDVRFALSPAFLSLAGGGLRGGTYRASGRAGLVLHGYTAIGGLRISGRWHGHRLRLRVGGRAAARGHVTITPAGRFTGVLAGARVSGRLPHRPPHPSGTGGVS